MTKKIGRTIRLAHHPCVYSFAAVVGSKEAEGPMGKHFTHVEQDPMLGQKTWEQAETRLQKLALQDALQNGCLQQEELDCIIAGDLVNQCTASTFAARSSAVPFLRSSLEVMRSASSRAFLFARATSRVLSPRWGTWRRIFFCSCA